MRAKKRTQTKVTETENIVQKRSKTFIRRRVSELSLLVLATIGLFVSVHSAEAQGTVTTPIGSSSDEADAVAMQSDGKIVVAGWSDNGTDDDFCRRIITDAKVGGIPISAFYADQSRPAPDRFVRFCFAKTDAVLGEACARLGRFLRG